MSTTYQITVKSTGHSSARFGACELCGKHAAEVFVGKRLAEYEPGQFTHSTSAGAIGHTFGHEACVRARLEA